MTACYFCALKILLHSITYNFLSLKLENKPWTRTCQISPPHSQTLWSPMLATYVATFAEFSDKPVKFPPHTVACDIYTTKLGCENHQTEGFAHGDNAPLCGWQSIRDFFFIGWMYKHPWIWHLILNSRTVITNICVHYRATDTLKVITLLKMSASPEATRNSCWSLWMQAIMLDVYTHLIKTTYMLKEVY